MPGILSRSSAGNLNGYKFKTVLGLSPLQNQTSASPYAYDAEHEEDEETDTQRAHTRNTAKPPSKPPRGRKLRGKIPQTQNHSMPPTADSKSSRAARPVRMDAQDGLWSVSVAEASPRFFTIYVKSNVQLILKPLY